MPVRSLRSSVFTWPDVQTVDRAVRGWAERIAQAREDVQLIDYFGSYARGDWGVGSDLDLIVIVKGSDQPFERRAAEWDVTELPVPAEVLVYTEEEWRSLARQGRFHHTVMAEGIWVWEEGRPLSL
jgi:uncharacterized protein